MARPQEIYAEIQAITERAVRLGISDSQQYPSIRTAANGLTHISVSGSTDSGLGFGGRPYRDIYTEIEASKSYNMRLLDGGLLLLQYTFRQDCLIKHRLAFWASPTLEAFQNEPDLYETDELYLDFLDPSIVPFPIRFDFGLEETANSPIVHPRSHLTLGQYQNCRIPVSSPLAPTVFVDFVLRNFYSSAHKHFASVAAGEFKFFDASIYDEERSIPHVMVAKHSAGATGRALRALFSRRGK